MTANRRNNQVARQQQPDILDRVFEWTERTFCAQNINKRNSEPEPKEDVLDYVFEHVESFACQEGTHEPDFLHFEHGLQRDNSLVETEEDGLPTHITTQRKVKPLGQQGDMIDYVFEHVESLVCAEGADLDDAPTKQVTPDRRIHNNDMTYKADKKRMENVYEPEDEIQLYFRPENRRRKSKRKH